MAAPPDALAERVLARDPRAVARAISIVEDGDDRAAALIAAIFPRTGRAFVIGVTGAPGGGKSTLVDRLIALVRTAGLTAGVIAVDPSSPFSGGAVLGDRVRMNAYAADEGVFVRSMATRGQLGGLARATGDAVTVLDAAGFDIVLIETVGVGQDEVDVATAADVTLVVLVPGTGDDVQAIKAGIMEIADVFVANKSDREGIDRLVHSIEAALSLQAAAPGAWTPPVVRTEATTGKGVDALWDTIGRFREQSAAMRTSRRQVRQEVRLRARLGDLLLARAERALPAGEVDRLARDVAERRSDPYTAAHSLAARAWPAGADGAS